MDDGEGGRESEDKGPTKMASESTSESPLVVVPCVLVPGESVSHVGTTRDGNCIVLTNYRLYATSSVKAGEESSAGGAFINVPLSCVESVEARDLFFIHVMCKDSRYYRVSFSDNAACEDWQRRLLTAINQQPASLEDSFACVHFKWALEAQFEELEEDYGCHANDVFCDTFRHEVARLGFDLNVAWRMSPVNKDFSFCPTYPPEILVPNCIDDKILVKVASFRSARRVPAVVWRHGLTGAVLARCSQPEVGWLGWRSADDEALVRAIADASAYDQPGSQSLILSDDLGGGPCDEKADISSMEGVPSLKDLSAEVAATVAKNAKVLIVDARSYPAAVGNRARGGGVECIEYYPFAEIIFMSLGNIHNIRKSFQALRSLCNQTPAEAFSGGSGWLAALDATKWLYHISGLLKAASRVATAMHNEGRSVLVHCSDGWDRTPQIVSLAQLMLDPYYRSIDGFRTLVEICWLDFGHKMADRNGTVFGVDDPNERAPIFLQWLDCVHQLLLQFPCHFEFNLSFLVKLAQHTYSSLFGTFLCNFLSERRRLKVSEKTRSVWDYLDHHQVKFRNFLYEGRMPKRTVDPFWPRCEVRDLLLWKDVYVVSDLKSTLSPSPALAPSSGSTNNNASTASSSGMNSRCDDAPGSSDQVDSGANSSKEEEENPKNDLKMVRDELQKLEHQNSSVVNGSEDSRSTTNNYDSDLTICDTNQRASLMGAVAQLRLGQQARAIESSTDTLVADVDERQVSHEPSAAGVSSGEKLTQQPEKPEVIATTGSSAPSPNHPSSSKQAEADSVNHDENHHQQQPGLSNGKMNGIESKSQNDGGCPSHCLMGCDLSLYFKEPIDTDGLTAHHNEVQERLVRIFASHQAEVQALRRDLHSTRVALLRQRTVSNGTSRGNHNGDDFLSVDIDSAARAVAMTINGTAIATHSGSSSTGACSDASSTWEAVDEKEANPTLWIPDHAVVSCMKCNTNFWFGRRKHHCRSCGRLFCRDCSNHNIPIPEEQLYHPVRVCDDCFEELGRTRNKDQIMGKEALEEDGLDESEEANHQAF